MPGWRVSSGWVWDHVYRNKEKGVWMRVSRGQNGEGENIEMQINKITNKKSIDKNKQTNISNEQKTKKEKPNKKKNKQTNKVP